MREESNYYIYGGEMNWRGGKIYPSPHCIYFEYFLRTIDPNNVSSAFTIRPTNIFIPSAKGTILLDKELVPYKNRGQHTGALFFRGEEQGQLHLMAMSHALSSPYNTLGIYNAAENSDEEMFAFPVRVAQLSNEEVHNLRQMIEIPIVDYVINPNESPYARDVFAIEFFKYKLLERLGRMLR